MLSRYYSVCNVSEAHSPTSQLIVTEEEEEEEEEEENDDDDDEEEGWGKSVEGLY